MEQDQAFLEYIVKAIVNHPEDVKSTRTVDERGVLITLDLNPTDMGYVIGRRGQTARAVRTLLKVVGAKNNARVNLKINEPEGGRGPRPRPYGDQQGMQGGMQQAPMQNNSMQSSQHDDIDTSAADDFNI